MSGFRVFRGLCEAIGWIVVATVISTGSKALWFFANSKAQNFGWPPRIQAVPEVPPLFQMADAAATKHGIEPLLFRALITQESGWNPDAASKAGAAGLTQLMPDTAEEECGLSDQQRFIPDKNLDWGAKYFATQLRRFESVDLALAAYNSGPDRVARLGRVPRIPETQEYVQRIMANWQSARK
jgi:soluble lytic murein transglycosylase-like protein